MTQTQSTLDLISKSITYHSAETQENWLVEVGNHLKEWERIEDNVVMTQCQILYSVWRIWESGNNPEGEFLSQEATYRWDYDFYKWAKAYSKRRSLKDPADITIGNKISVYRDWIAESLIEYPDKVYIPKRDKYGHLIDPNLKKDEAWEEVEFDPKDCDYSKLLVSRGSARKGEMSPESWSALRDPYSTVAVLKENMRRDTQEDDFRMVEENGIIYGISKGRKKAIFQVLFENDEGDDLFSRSLCFGLKAMGLHVPLEYQK